jgi:hypothetical protein
MIQGSNPWPSTGFKRKMICTECKEEIEKPSGYTDIMGSVIELKEIYKYDLRTIEPLCDECFKMYQCVDDMLGGVIR